MKRVFLFLLAQLLLLVVVSAAAQEAGGEERCEGPVYMMREVSRRPIIISKPDPGFTEEARRNNVSGTVSLAAVFCHTGRVTDVRVLKSLPAGLTELSVAATRRVQFQPGEKDGRPVSTQIRFEYNFNAAGDKPEVPDAKPPDAGHNRRLVEELTVEGNRRLTDEEIIRHIKTRPGEPYSAEQMERDLRALLNLPSLDSTQTRVATEEGRRGGIAVILYVAERPIIRDLTFSGMRVLVADDVLRAWREAGVRVCKECPYDPSQITAAKAVVRGLLKERREADVTVEVTVVELSAVSVTLDFAVTTGRRFD